VLEPTYDPWDDIDEALDAGEDPVDAHDEARRQALEWHLAESAQSRVVYLRDRDRERRRNDPRRRAQERARERRRPKRIRDRAEYMRAYRQQKKAA
jgi:hypothetical protein